MTTEINTRIAQLRRLELALRARHTSLAKYIAMLERRLRCLRIEITDTEKERLALETEQFEEQGLITYRKPLSVKQMIDQVDNFTKEEAAELLALLESELNQPAELPAEPEDRDLDEFGIEMEDLKGKE